MLFFLIRRIGYALIMIVLVSFVSFVLIELPPGDFLSQKIQSCATEVIAAPSSASTTIARATVWTSRSWNAIPTGSSISCAATLANFSI